MAIKNAEAARNPTVALCFPKLAPLLPPAGHSVAPKHCDVIWKLHWKVFGSCDLPQAAGRAWVARVLPGATVAAACHQEQSQQACCF